jgi:nitroreductase
MSTVRLVSLGFYREYPLEEMKRRAASFRTDMQRRRSIRRFSNRVVPREIIEECLQTAASAPSGANMQPWHFVAVSDPGTKRQIREAAEKEEYEFYHGRAGEEGLGALSVLGTDCQKPFLEAAPYLIVIFAQSFAVSPDGRQVKQLLCAGVRGDGYGVAFDADSLLGLLDSPFDVHRACSLSDVLRTKAITAALIGSGSFGHAAAVC